jgi:hypothetical protein
LFEDKRLGENTGVCVGVFSTRACLADCMYSNFQCWTFVFKCISKSTLGKHMLDKGLLYMNNIELSVIYKKKESSFKFVNNFTVNDST